MPGPADELIRWATLAAGPTGAADRDLLARFVAGRDQAAFLELVRRHGPVVFGVCRRVVGHRQDAEDAFQATFLVLARKADQIGRPDALGGWLYAVAVRVARKARRAADRRRSREAPVYPLPDSPAAVVDRCPELAGVIDEELAALPSWYRDAVVLCDLRGQSRTEAAGALGIAEGTLSSRLNAGRKKLAARLTRRGIGVPAAGVAATLGTDATAVAPRLVVSATDAALAGSAGEAVAANVQFLAAEWGWGVGKVKLLAAAVVAAGVGVGTVAGWSGEKPGDEPAKPAAPNPKPQPAAKAEVPADKPKGPTKPRLLRSAEMPGSITNPPDWSPDGRLFAIGNETGVYVFSPEFPPNGSTLEVPSNPVVEGRFSSGFLGFAGDGDHPSVAVYRTGRGNINATNQVEFWDAFEMKRLRQVDIDPALGRPVTLLPDGKTVLAMTVPVDETANDPGFGSRSLERRGQTPSQPRADRETVFRLIDTTATETEPPTIRVGGRAVGWSALPDRRLAVVTITPEGWVGRCYSFADGKVVWERPFEGGAAKGGYRNHITASADGKTLAVVILRKVTKLLSTPTAERGGGPGMPGRDDLVSDTMVIDSATGETRVVLDREGEGMSVVMSFSHDGRLVVGPYYPRNLASSAQIQTRIWDARGGKVLLTWNGSSLAGFSPVKPTLVVIEKFTETGMQRTADGTRPRTEWSSIGLWDVSSLLK